MSGDKIGQRECASKLSVTGFERVRACVRACVCVFKRDVCERRELNGIE